MTEKKNEHVNWASTAPWKDVAGSIGGFFGGGDNKSEYVHPFGAAQQSNNFAGRQGHHPHNGPPAAAPATPARSNTSGRSGSSWLPNLFGPRTPQRTGNTASQPSGARANNNATARSGWGLNLFGGTADTVGMANSVTNASGGKTTRVRPGETLPVTPRNQALAQPGARALPGGNVQTRNASGGTTTRVFNPGALNRPNASGNQVIRTQTQLRNLPVTKHNQARADARVAAGAATAAGTGDVHNWAGIARDLGNAGDKRWASHATGELPSTGALKWAANNPTHQAAGSTAVSQARAQGLTRNAGATAPARATSSARSSGMTAAQSTAKRRENAAAYRKTLARTPTQPAASAPARTPSTPRRRTDSRNGPR